MQLSQRFWATVTHVSSWLFSSTLSPNEPQQIPIKIPTHHLDSSGAPIFYPPGGRKQGPGDDFQCKYPLMKGWSPCYEEDSTCWLKKDDGSGERLDIHTNYEKQWPNGTTRYYDLTVYDGWFNADGINFTEAKLYNSTNPGPLFDGSVFPGPWIQACWGDTVYINVTNKMKFNGTSIHWHGIRQLNTMHMDGVNGVTQCPIAPGDHFLYKFHVTQYGSSWYHSHYSVQYADGLQGPITLHGPSSAQYDEAKLPVIMTDWGHVSAFQSVYTFDMANPSILLNGRGNITKFTDTKHKLPIPAPYNWTFVEEKNSPDGPRKYLLRVINTSFGSGFIFSIDNHWLQVVEADFVPIEPYWTKSIMINIGQRYDVIVHAKPDAAGGKLPANNNYWIRTWFAKGCTEIQAQTTEHYSETGVLRYLDKNGDYDKSDPASAAWPGLSLDCLNETYHEAYKPVVKWKIPPLSKNGNGKGQEFDVAFQQQYKPFPLSLFSFQSFYNPTFSPLRISYENPTFFHLNDETLSFPANWVVVPENYTETDWVFLILANNMGFANHPIHLHGHDFAIVQYKNDSRFEPSMLKDNNLDNPPRRDVVTLPGQGFVVIAFKTDNPGNWLMHCHIAYHASMGLGLQILERGTDADKIWPHGNSAALTEAHRVCKNWSRFFNDCRNWWPGLANTTTKGNGKPKYAGCNVYEIDKNSFQDDSGI